MNRFRQLSWLQRWLLRAASACTYTFLYLPILTLAVYSFNSSRYATVWEGFSVRWFQALPDNVRLLAVLKNSLSIATWASLLAVLLGTGLALCLHRTTNSWRQRWIKNASFLPLVLPDLVIGIGFLILFAKFIRPSLATLGIEFGSMVSVAAGHATVGLAYVMVIVSARLRDLDPHIEESAANLGAPPHIVFGRIILPQIRPAMLSGALIAFALSLDDFYIAYFTTAGGSGFQTLPLYIFALQARAGVSPELNALSTAMLVFSALIVVLGLLIERPRLWQNPEALERTGEENHA